MKIAAVVVTYNRINDLKKAISRYEQQTYPLSYLIIIDNASSDGTKEYLEVWRNKQTEYKKKVIHLKTNTGGSGGFYTGFKYALELDCDWLWIADDDAFLDYDAFNQLSLFMKKNIQIMPNCVALAGSVVLDPDTMEYDLGHRRTITKKMGMPFQRSVEANEYKKDFFRIDLFTFVGTLIKVDAVKKVGLPHGDFFIYFDDLEYAYRIGKKGSIYCVPACKIFHNTGKHEEPYGSNWRSFYQSRNMMLFYKEHFPVAFFVLIWKRIFQRILLKIVGSYTSINQLDWDAMIAAVKGKKGISDKYYIGWKNKT